MLRNDNKNFSQIEQTSIAYKQNWTAIRHPQAQLDWHKMTDDVQELLSIAIEYTGSARELPMTTTTVCKITIKKHRAITENIEPATKEPKFAI